MELEKGRRAMDALLDVAGLNAAIAAAIAGGVQLVSLSPRESALEAEFHAAVGLPTGGAS